jgi:hypothetical protein
MSDGISDGFPFSHEPEPDDPEKMRKLIGKLNAIGLAEQGRANRLEKERDEALVAARAAREALEKLLCEWNEDARQYRAAGCEIQASLCSQHAAALRALAAGKEGA